MANNNTPLWDKFAKLFASETFIDNTRGLFLARSFLRLLAPNEIPSTDDATLLNQVTQKMEEWQNAGKNTDNSLVLYFANFLPQTADCRFAIMGMGLDLVSEIMCSPVYKSIPMANRKIFETEVDKVYGYKNISVSCQENKIDPRIGVRHATVVLNEDTYRRMINASGSMTAKEKKFAENQIANAINDFDREYDLANMDGLRLNKMLQGPRNYYGNTSNAQKNALGKLRASYANWLDKDKANEISTFNENTVYALKGDVAAQNSAIIGEHTIYDETVMAVMKRKNIDPNLHQSAFIGRDIDGSDEKNPNLGVQILKTFAFPAASAAVSSFAMGLARSIPVVGKYVGMAVGITSILSKGHKEIAIASAVAKERGEQLSLRDAGRIALKTAKAAAPYALNMVASLVADGTGLGIANIALRSIGAISMGVHTYLEDLNTRKAKLRRHEKLTTKDYLKSVGKAALKTAVVTGASIGGAKLGNVVGGGMFANGLRENAVNNQTQTETTEHVAKETVIDNANTEQVVGTQNQGTVNFANLDSDGNGIPDYLENRYVDQPQEFTQTQTPNLNQMEDLNNNGVPDYMEHHDVRTRQFDLTSNARATANPDNDRMWINGEQKDWYGIEDYHRAIQTLSDHGYADPDGALRNLAGAARFLPNEFQGELDSLLHGQMTGNTDALIDIADNILDETADLKPEFREKFGFGVSNSSSHNSSIGANGMGANYTDQTEKIVPIPEETENYNFNEKSQDYSLGDKYNQIHNANENAERLTRIPDEVERYQQFDAAVKTNQQVTHDLLEKISAQEEAQNEVDKYQVMQDVLSQDKYADALKNDTEFRDAVNDLQSSVSNTANTEEIVEMPARHTYEPVLDETEEPVSEYTKKDFFFGVKPPVLNIDSNGKNQ